MAYRWILAGLFSLGVGLASLPAADTNPTSGPAPAKRPIQHSDYEIWNRSQPTETKLSPCGRYFAYVLTDAQGAATLVLRTIDGGEKRYPYTPSPASSTPGSSAGSSPSPSPAPAPEPTPTTTPEPNPAGSSASTNASAGLRGPVLFSPDGRYLLATLPAEPAPDAKPSTSRTTRYELCLIETSSGNLVERQRNIRSYTVVGSGAGLLVTLQEEAPRDLKGQDSASEKKAEAAPTKTPPAKSTQLETKTEPAADAKVDAKSGTTSTTTRPTTLVLRSLAGRADSPVTKYDGVSNFQSTEDDLGLLVTRSLENGTKTDFNFLKIEGSQAGQPASIYAGSGRLGTTAWDEDQKRLAFFVIEGTGAAARSSAWLWERGPQPGSLLLSSRPTGTPDGQMISERGGLSFSADGMKLNVGLTAIPPEPKPEPKAQAKPEAKPQEKGETLPPPRPANPSPTGSTTPPTLRGRFSSRGSTPTTSASNPTAPAADPDRVDLDLWHWKDELIQPMQAKRGNAGRPTPPARATYYFDTKKFQPVPTIENWDLTVPGYGDWTRISSDQAYRGMQWMSPTPRDYDLLNLRSGERKTWLRGHLGSVESPVGNYVLSYDGKDWKSTNLTTLAVTNLTAKLGIPFYNIEHDTPNLAPAYGLRGYTADRKHALIADQFDLWKVALDGSGATNLTKIGRTLKIRFSLILEPGDSTQKLDLNKPYWLSAEHQITRETGFYRLKPGQEPQLVLMAAKRFGSPIRAKNSNRVVVNSQTFYDAPNYYATTTDFQELRRITNLQPRKDEFLWGRAELVQYKSADGVPLQGVLIKPENFDSSQKYPMIVYIYEKLSNTLHSFRLPSAGTSINPTYYASNGYLVFMPDIVYTTGAPGQSALKCVLPAIQAVVDQGIVNEQAIGIQGHSWGGYQIAYLVTQTNRFKAANAGAPVSNMVSAYGGIRWGTGLPRQFQYEQTQSRIGATLWQTPLKYIENSPVFMADRVQTPLMMLHNDQDDAVPWYQGIEYYLALRRLGKEVYLFNYNGEFHGLRRKATQRDYTVRMQQFFDHHLKGAPMPEWMAKGIPFSEREKEKEAIKKLFAPAKTPAATPAPVSAPAAGAKP